MVRQSKRRYSTPMKHEAYKYKSRFGSHEDMADEEKTGELNKENKVVIEDEHGYYITDESRLDSGLADPNRYDPKRLTWFKKETTNA